VRLTLASPTLFSPQTSGEHGKQCDSLPFFFSLPVSKALRFEMTRISPLFPIFLDTVRFEVYRRAAPYSSFFSLFDAVMEKKEAAT